MGYLSLACLPVLFLTQSSEGEPWLCERGLLLASPVRLSEARDGDCIQLIVSRPLLQVMATGQLTEFLLVNETFVKLKLTLENQRASKGTFH